MRLPKISATRVGMKKYAGKVAAAAAVGAAAVGLMAQYGGGNTDPWWEVGSGRSMPLFATFPNASGEVMVLSTAGPLSTREHPFFESMGTNGRACVTCHQPSNAMSLGAAQVQERWKETKGDDPVFAAIDGSNCPTLPQKEKSSHSLLLNRGLFRIYLPWPAVGADGKPIQPEFTIEVVHDPTGCNTDPRYGLQSTHPTISVYRRPRVVANLKYVLNGTGGFEIGTLGVTKAQPVSLAADGRDASLEQQAEDAVRAHEQAGRRLSKAELKQILEFESQIYVAQTSDVIGGDLAEVDGPLGAWSLGRGTVDDASHAVFFDAKYWKAAPFSGIRTAQSDFRQSVARGNAIFMSRTFSIGGTANLTGSHATAPAMGTCATCHTAGMAGSNAAQRAMDVGTTVMPYALDATADAKELPLFKITCKGGAEPHPYLGRVIYTSDPGRALITGKCSDVGSIVMQQFRGLAARAPYFSNGSAASLREVVEFYDRRFTMQLTEMDKRDLTNFLSAL